MIAIIDYDAGNTKSVQKALEYLGEKIVLTRDIKVIEGADKVVLPGVGAFGDAMNNLNKYNLVDCIKDTVASKKPFLGICLGLQVLFEESDEASGVKGIGLIKGNIKSIPMAEGCKIPHMGWNNIDIKRHDSRLLKGIDDKSYFYFMHSYYAEATDKSDVAATCTYTTDMDVIVEKDNLFATQFHPEKSDVNGLKILKNFIDL